MESFCPAYTTQTEHLLWQEESIQTESTSHAHSLPEAARAKVQTWPKNDAFIDEQHRKAARDSILNFYKKNDNFFIFVILYIIKIVVILVMLRASRTVRVVGSDRQVYRLR